MSDVTGPPPPPTAEAFLRPLREASALEVLEAGQRALREISANAAVYQAVEGSLQLSSSNLSDLPPTLDARGLVDAADEARWPIALLGSANWAGASQLAERGFTTALLGWRKGELRAVLFAAGAPGASHCLDLAACALQLVRARRRKERAERREQTWRASHDLTAATRSDELAFVAVHKLSGVFDHELAAMAILRSGSARIVAVSGREVVDRAEPAIGCLESFARAVAAAGQPIAVLTDAPGPPQTASTAGADLRFVQASRAADGPDEDVASTGAHALAALGHAGVVAVPLTVERRVRAVFLAAVKDADVVTSRAARKALATYCEGVARHLHRLLDLEDLPLLRLHEVARPLARSLRASRPRRIAAWVLVLAGLLVGGNLWERELSITGACRVTAGRRAAVWAPADGQLAEVAVADGAIVAAGDVLATTSGPGGPANITAPIAGFVTASELDARLGAPVRAGERLATVAAERGLAIEVTVRAADLDVVAIGSQTVVSLQAAPGRSLKGLVRELRGQGDGSFSAIVELDVTGDRARLRPGLTGRARMRCGRRSALQIALRRLRQGLGLTP